MKEIHYLLGNSCNLNCDFCFWDMRVPDVSWKTKKNIVDEIKKAGIKKVTISGGEPSITKDYIKTLRYMSDNKLSVVLHTNGLKINNMSARKIAPLVERVSLSLDGSCEEMCMKMRKTKNVFNHTSQLIDLFHRLKVPVNIKTLVTKVNFNDILNIGEVLRDKPIAYWSLLEFNPINRGKLHKSKFYLTKGEFNKTVRKIKNNIKGLNIRVRLFKSEPQSYCFIDASGKVYTFLPNKGDVLIGDLKNNSLKSLFSLL
jgi:MoaA/NifB/PqqE/SkfB family radical SAM enzyme